MIEQILQADRLLQVDQVTRARGMYARVVELDPGNAIAVVGLARCALAEGDEREAYRLATRALQIDPENDMARRMEARLSEILATRGEAVARPAVAATASSREMRPVMVETGTGRPPTATHAPSPVRPAAAPAPSPARPTTRPPVRPAAREPVVRKTLLQRLLGR